MKYFTYILQSEKDFRYYIGHTSDLERRLREHNSGKTKSLRYRRPLQLIYFEEYDSREQAAIREKEIKVYKGRNAFRKLIAGSSSRYRSFLKHLNEFGFFYIARLQWPDNGNEYHTQNT